MTMPFRFQHQSYEGKKKAMTEEIVQISILHPKTFKEFYHTQGFGKVLWKAGVL